MLFPTHLGKEVYNTFFLSSAESTFAQRTWKFEPERSDLIESKVKSNKLLDLRSFNRSMVVAFGLELCIFEVDSECELENIWVYHLRVLAICYYTQVGRFSSEASLLLWGQVVFGQVCFRASRWYSDTACPVAWIECWVKGVLRLLPQISIFCALSQNNEHLEKQHMHLIVNC